jgi:hypothetical protein
VIVALACIGTAVVLYAVVLRQHEGDRNGLRRLAGPGSRHHLAGVVSLLSVVTLRQAGAGAGALATSQALVAINSWTFLLGQSFLPVVNALLLGSLLYRSCLVARTIPLLGPIGATLLLISRFRRAVRSPATGVRVDGDQCPPDRAVGSSRWAFGWSPKPSSPRPSPMEWSPPVSRKKMIMAPRRRFTARDLYRMIVSPLGQLDRHRSIRLPDSLHCLRSAV